MEKFILIKPLKGGFKQVRTNQKTFGKATKLYISKNIKGARYFKKVFDSYVIQDSNRKTIATWQPGGINQNGLIIIH